MPKTQEMRLDLIRLDGGTQTRAALHDGTVRDYAEAMENGATFPPLMVLFDGKVYWLWDGFHRYHAYRTAGIGECECVVTEGTKEDALILALGANAAHGLPRSNADKRSAVELCLKTWPDWSDNRVAETCAVSQPFVGRVRKDTQPITVISQERVGKDGKTRKMPERPVSVQPVCPAERQPGDETEAGGDDPAPVNNTVSRIFDSRKPAGVKGKGTSFDDSEFFKLYGTLVRLVQSRAEIKKCINSPEHKATCAALDALLAAYENWQKRRAA